MVHLLVVLKIMSKVTVDGISSETLLKIAYLGLPIDNLELAFKKFESDGVFLRTKLIGARIFQVLYFQDAPIKAYTSMDKSLGEILEDMLLFYKCEDGKVSGPKLAYYMTPRKIWS